MPTMIAVKLGKTLNPLWDNIEVPFGSQDRNVGIKNQHLEVWVNKLSSPGVHPGVDGICMYSSSDVDHAYSLVCSFVHSALDK